MHRTQIMLTDEQHTRLKEESGRTGLSLAELIRQALDRRFAEPPTDRRLELLDVAFGSWKDRDESGAEYVERIRSGTSRRLSGTS